MRFLFVCLFFSFFNHYSWYLCKHYSNSYLKLCNWIWLDLFESYWYEKHTRTKNDMKLVNITWIILVDKTELHNFHYKRQWCAFLFIDSHGVLFWQKSDMVFRLILLTNSYKHIIGLRTKRIWKLHTSAVSLRWYAFLCGFWPWCAFNNRSLLKKHINLLSKCTSRLAEKRIHIKLVSSVCWLY